VTVFAVGALVLAAAYAVAAWRAMAGPRGWSRPRLASWLTGCALIAVAASPIPHVLAPGAAGHMVQHLLLGMFAPLALAMGAPVTLLLRVASVRTRRRVARVLSVRYLRVAGHPAGAAVLSVGGLFAVMLTPLYAAVHANTLAHHALHLHYLAAGYLFAWAVAGPDPAPRRPGMAARVAALVLAGAAHAWLAKHLYAQAPPYADALRQAAQIMYYGGDVAEILLATALFATWYRRRARRAIPVISKS